jgi:hypothetical protein
VNHPDQDFIEHIIRNMNELRFDTAWLKHRLELFRSFTYPSILDQTDKNFEWLGYVHEDSPEWFLKAFEEFELIKIVKVIQDTDGVPRGTTTINLDSDDAISRNFIEKVRSSKLKPGVYCFPNGIALRVNDGNCLNFSSNTNPFNIAVGDQTVLDALHGCFPSTEIIACAEPMWLQINHSDNIQNKFRTYSKNRYLSFSEITKPFNINYKVGMFK